MEDQAATVGAKGWPDASAVKLTTHSNSNIMTAVSLIKQLSNGGRAVICKGDAPWSLR